MLLTASSFRTSFTLLEHGTKLQPRNVINFREVAYIPEDKIEEFQERLHALHKEFSEMDDPQSETGHPWALPLFLYPTFYYEQLESD